MKSMVKWWLAPVPALLAVWVSGCGDTTPPESASSTDGGDTGGLADNELADPDDIADTTAESDTTLDTTSDAGTDADVTTDVVFDADVTTVAGVDADAPTDIVADASHDATTDADAATDTSTDADVVPAPTVSVSTPLAGRYTLGSSLQVAWESSDADTVTLSLVTTAELCSEGDAGVVVPDLFSSSALTTTYTWEVPTTLAPADYRVRVRATSMTGVSSVACSAVFSLVQPPGCSELGCAAQNRVCTTDAGVAECAGCVDGFTDGDGVCVVVDCGATPAAPSNAILAGVSTTRFGGVATYTCLEGYTTTGLASASATVTRRCGSLGVWEDASGECSPVECGELSGVVNGTVTVAEATFGNTATYECDAGYSLSSGTTTRTCEANGEWSGSAVVCTAVDCGTPPGVTDGARSFTTTTLGSSAAYTCDSGYILTGTPALTCSTAGDWGPAPTCTDINECVPAGTVCTAPNNVCTNTTGSWECSCAVGFTGTTITGGNATCDLPPVLGDPCSTDSDCPDNAWCPTDTTQRYCSPRPTLPEGITMAFQYVPSGAFTMGSPVEEVGRDIDENQVTVTLMANYFVSRTEVTQGQWKAVTGGSNPSYFQNTECILGTCISTENANDRGPVERVDWYSALAYANWLSMNQGLNACYTLSGCADESRGWYDGTHTGCSGATFLGYECTGYRLLTEAEWERAARAGTVTATYRGDLSGTVDGCTFAQANLDPIAWWCRISGDRTGQVETREPNAWGLYDMLGNVGEWTWDTYSPTLLGGTNPTGPSEGSRIVVRGGYWSVNARGARAAYRPRSTPTIRNYSDGFRLARTLP